METIALLATIIAGIAALYAIIFGSKPLLEVILKRQGNGDVIEQNDRENETGDDEYSILELAIEKLKNEASRTESELFAVLAQEHRLRENIFRARNYGDDESRQADRAEIVAHLNGITKILFSNNSDIRSFTDLSRKNIPSDSVSVDSAQSQVSTPSIELGQQITNYTNKIKDLMESTEYDKALGVR